MGTDCSGDVLSGGLSFTWEPVGLLLKHGLHEMAAKHWQEAVGDKVNLPYNPDWEGYQRAEQAKDFAIIAVRWSGHLIGYAGIRIYSSLQSKGVICAYVQEYYIEPAFRRRGNTGLKLFGFIHGQLKLLRVNHVAVQAPDIALADRGGLGKLFDRLGYQCQGTHWTRSLG